MSRPEDKSDIDAKGPLDEPQFQSWGASDEQIQAMSAAELRQLCRAQRVHLAELEVENEALGRSRADLENIRDYLMELYHFAPVGFVSVNEKGGICSANQTAEMMLAGPRGVLIGKALSSFVAEVDRDKYFRFIKALQKDRPHGWEEIGLVQAGGSRFDVRLEGKAREVSKGGIPKVRLAISDISEKKSAERELGEARDQLRELAGHLQSAREEERSIMAREIHDDVGQVLLALKLGISSLEGHLSEADDNIRERIQGMKNSLAQCIQFTKHLITRLRPFILDELGLPAAMHSHAHDFQSQTGIEVALGLAETYSQIDAERETALFRIFQEALANVARHSKATHVDIRLSFENNEMRLDISDNGIGIKPSQVKSRNAYGLIGMRERAFAFGGDVCVAGQSARGTRLTARIPS